MNYDEKKARSQDLIQAIGNRLRNQTATDIAEIPKMTSELSSLWNPILPRFKRAATYFHFMAKSDLGNPRLFVWTGYVLALLWFLVWVLRP